MHRLVHYAVVLIVLSFVLVGIGVATEKKPEPRRYTGKNGQVYLLAPDHTAPMTLQDKILAIIALTFLVSGNLILIIDSFRRKYTTSPYIPWLLTLGGFAMCFVTPFIYYFIWGRHPLPQSDEIYSAGFCPACAAETTEESAGNTFTLNFIYGVTLLGARNRCPVCLSVIKTKWVLCVVPVAPLGSFRVVYIAPNHYLSRKVR